MSGTSMPERPVAVLAVDPAEATPGFAVRMPVLVTSQLAVPATFLLDVVGLDPQWVTLPGPIGPLAPGQHQVAELVVTIPVGHPAAHLRSSVRASVVSNGEAAQPQDGGRAGATDLVVVVGDGSQIGAALEPPEVRGGWRGRFDLVLFNRAHAPLRVELGASSPDPSVSVRFKEGTEVLVPGKEARVRGRVEAHRPVMGTPRRRPFAVRVQGRTTPVSVEGTFHQRAVIGGSLMRIAAIGVVVALWAAVATVGIRTLDHRLQRSALQRQNATNPPPPAVAQPSGGSGTGSGSAGGGSGSTGGSSGGGSSSGGGGSSSGGGGSSSGAGGPSSGTGGGGSSSGGSGSSSGGTTSNGGAPSTGGGSSGGGSSGAGSSGGGAPGGGASAGGGSGASAGGGSGAPAGAGVTGGTTRVSGKVAAAQPGAVTVSIAPTSLVDEAAQAATQTNQTTAIETAFVANAPDRAPPQGPIGKIYGAFASPSAVSALTASDQPMITTTTTPDGAWAFEGIRAPGDYLVTFSKPGYATQRYIVTVDADGKPVTLSASISPGGGALSGRVFSPSGPLGNVNMTITDGTTTVQAKTPTVGAVGTWAVSGLTTPDTYLVMATATGYSTQTALVTLTASGSTSGVNLTMQPGQGSLTGTVTSARTGKGVGGVTVTTTNGSVSRTATSTTRSPVGSYALPDLDIPGTYAVTVSGDGWVSQTQLVTLTGNAVVNAALTPSGADVNGVVSGSNGGGLGGAGIVLSNDTNTFKTLTESAPPVGGFDFGQIPPGQYVLTATDFGYTTESAEVSVGPGQTQTVNLTLPFVGQANVNTATIQGTVLDLFNATPLGPPQHIVSIALDHKPTSVTTNVEGSYVIPGVGPGVHTVTASAAGFEAASVSVSVALGGVAFAPVIGLPKLDTVAGQVRSNAGGFVPNPCAQLRDPQNPTVVLFQSAACTTRPPVPNPTFPGIPPTALGGFEIDNVPHGNYDLVLSGSNGSGCNVGSGFISNVSNPIAISLTLDTDLVLTGTQSPALDLGPAFNVVTVEATAGGGVPAQVGGVTVTVTDQTDVHAPPSSCPSPAPPPSGSPPTPTVVPNLTFGHSYRATFSDPATGATAPPITFTAILNNSTVDSALLYTPPSIGKVTLQFNYTVSGTTTVCKVETPSATCSPSSAVPNPPGPPQVPDLPQVRLTGTVGFTFSGPGQPGAPIQNSFTATANGDGTWSFAPSDISQLLPSASVMFSVTDPVGAFQPFSVTLSPTIPAGVISLQPFTLTPAPVTITNGTCVGSVSPSSGVPVTVTVSPPIQGASVVVGGCPPGVPGNLIWQTTSPAVQAQPGVYTLTFSAPGFDSQTAFYAVPFFPGVAFPNNLTITLVAHVTLIVTPTFTPQPNLAFPTVFLFRTTSGSNVLVGQQTLSSTLLSATFPDLSVQDRFEVDIRGPGFETSITPGINLNNGTTISPTLTAEGFITGTLNGRINTTTSPLAGQTVTATSDGTCASAGPLSVTTDADGKFTIVGDPSTADGGLCNTATYTLSASVPGYALATTTVPISSTGANAAPEPPATNAFVAVANKIVQKVTVTDLDGNAIKPPPGSSTGGVALSITDFSPIGSPVTFTQEPDKITYDLTIDPTSYKFFFTATGYTPQTLGPIPYSPNESPPLLTVKLLLDKNTITGTVTTPGPGGTTVPLPGVTVSLFPDTLGAQAFTSVTTNSSGVYTLTSEGGGKNPTYIPDGTYVLGATLAGYTYLQQPQAFQTTLPETIVNLSLVPNQVRVSVAVSSNLGSSSDLTGATVTLTPVTSAGSPPPCGSPLVPGFGTAQSATVASSTATFNQVVPDVYTLTASDPNHPAQTGTRLTVCPGGSMSTSFTFQEGEVTGTVSVPDGFGLLPSNVTLNLFAGGSPSGPPLAFTETCPSSSNSCTFFAFVPLNSVYTAQASMTGLTTQTQTTSSQVTTQNPTANVTLNLLAAPREVDVTVNSGGTSPIPLAAGTVKLSGTTLSATIANGLATLTGVAPSTSPYTITVTDRAITASGSVLVPIGVGTVPITVTAAFGQISGSVVLSPAPKKSTNVMATVCDGATLCATPIETVPLTADTSGNAPYTLQLPPSSANGDVVTFSAGSPYVDQHTNPLTVTDGGQIQVPTITLTAPPPSTTTTT